MGLDVRAIEQPGIARHDPADRIGIDAVREQPEARVHARLACADDHEAARRARAARQLVQRHAANTGRHFVERAPHRGHAHAHVAGVDDLLLHIDTELAARRDGHEAPVPEVRAAREILHAPRRQKLALHHLIEVRADFGARGELVEARVPAHAVLHLVAKRLRVHAVEGGRLVQAHVGVRVVPVPARAMVLVDQQHRRVRLGDYGIGERHAHRAAADQEVIGAEGLGRHGLLSLTTPGPLPRSRGASPASPTTGARARRA